MKNGLLIYTPLNGRFNIGDYIQSLAAKQFFKEPPSVYVDRDQTSEYKGEVVKLIMNGWYSHSPENWPPSDYIIPLFVSFHINETIKEYFLSDESIKYFKRHEPIGCRDYNTIRMLKEKGVDAFFSGCMTLTLGETYKNTEERKKIYIVDPFFEFKRDIKSLFKYMSYVILKPRVIKEIYNKTKKSVVFPFDGIKGMIMAAALYRQFKSIITDEVFREAEFICQEFYDKDFDGFEEKFKKADEILKKYSNAKYVITSRIHCALPCLGMNTPVAFVLKEEDTVLSSCRFEGLVELFNIIKINKGSVYSNFLNNKFYSDTVFCNKGSHIGLKNELIKRCRQFTEK